MTPTERLAELMALRVQGLATPERLAVALGICEAEATGRVAALCDGGLATRRSARVEGYALTPDGNEMLAKDLAVEGLRGDEGLTAAYERFCELDAQLKQIASDWQVRRRGGSEVPNDHSDADYDRGVIDRLSELHDRAMVCVRRMGRCAERFGPYARRLNACVERAVAGDASAVTAALAESYHTVWFELHQDLLLTLGLRREE